MNISYKNCKLLSKKHNVVLIFCKYQISPTVTQFENAAATETRVEERLYNPDRPPIRRRCQICFTFESSCDSDESTVARENASADIGMETIH